MDTTSCANCRKEFNPELNVCPFCGSGIRFIQVRDSGQADDSGEIETSCYVQRPWILILQILITSMGFYVTDKYASRILAVIVAYIGFVSIVLLPSWQQLIKEKSKF